MTQRFRVAMLSAESVPYAKVGGLADVVGALSKSIADLGCSVAVFLPRYGSLAIPEGASLELVAKIDVPLRGEDTPALVYALRAPDLPAHLAVYFVANDHYFGRTGIYNDPATGEAFPDNAERFAFYARASLEAMRALAFAPEVIHANDHQAALVPAYLRTVLAEDPFFGMTATILSIHNMGYQGVYEPDSMQVAGFPAEYFYPLSPFEFWGKMNYLKAGIHFADVITTVSERYVEAIQSGEEFGFGLQGVLNARREDLVGIMNGIDVKIWNPRADRMIAARYDAESLESKEVCKAALLDECALPGKPAWPLFGIISRLAEQKGFDLIEAAADRLFALPARWVLLGSGSKRYEELFEGLEKRFPDRLKFRKGFDDPLAHRIEAGADFFLMPSRFEPCGLNQMYSLRYGTLPIVRATGGLVDTVTNYDEPSGGGTGFMFDDLHPEALANTIGWAVSTWYDRPQHIDQMRRRAMAQDFSWERAAHAYRDLYLGAYERRRGHAFK
ncbi:MAG TPA: glycogen/starch synthase [Candidatus Polarisedimenticolia bacterium]|nr:glycogen/starch synthase [Candidatus Polarisedimenticolia bacterium]